DPVKLLALLKHPYAAFGMDRSRCLRAARSLELALLRGRRVAGAIAALGDALARAKAEGDDPKAHMPAARRRLWPEDWQRAGELVAALQRGLGPGEGAVR